MIRPLAALALALLLSADVGAQVLRGGTSGDTPRRPVSTAHAITNARVVVAPGRVLDRATVLVRDGRIVAVGDGADVPFDAHVIEGDSLWVYAGFIDGFATAGVAEPDDIDYDGDRGDPPREVAGIIPDRDVRGAFNPADAAVKALREAGFAAAHVAPTDGMLAGTGRVVLLREIGRAEYLESLFLPGTETAIAQIDGASGVYPATPMGVLSVMRETMENARREASRREAFSRDAASADRPQFDPVHEALQPVISGDRPMVFHAESWLEAHRALRATEEMEIPRTLLAGVPDVAPALDRIRARGLGVIAPLALPDSVEADSLAQAALPTTPEARAGGISFVTERRTSSFRDTESEKAVLTAQRIASVTAVEQSPLRLSEAEVPFAFGSFEAKGRDVRTNLRRMVNAGLSPEAALGALTTAPADLMGLSSMLGTVERGKLANLVVTTGDYFADTTQVRFVFVEGVRHEIEAKASTAASGDPDAVVEIAGRWSFEIETPGGAQDGTIVITGDPGSFEGELVTDDGTLQLQSVTLDGNALAFSFTVPDGNLNISVSGIVTGDEFEGTADVGAFGAFPMTATRQPE